jgi:cytochrome P450
MAVEELLRYFTIVEYGNSRMATDDVELAGTTIRAGEAVVSLSNTANHDPEIFPDAGRLKLDRGSRNHLAFGYVGRLTAEPGHELPRSRDRRHPGRFDENSAR